MLFVLTLKSLFLLRLALAPFVTFRAVFLARPSAAAADRKRRIFPADAAVFDGFRHPFLIVLRHSSRRRQVPLEPIAGLLQKRERALFLLGDGGERRQTGFD